ncbi:hypothetical protein [Aquimarina muelleri]|uniref:Uncharacterized protein n=1 Tax=Aquimarina muelleri TaxID=279356 RepID=A0A918JYE3_9FLAO|nr:hypothetical protein [Aquimarina muelleri]MCX2764936.1 hypothetical protein [Aquimarina muelleri]GGX33825.1 hypothetical protein GCM10007384_38160 [Aquimarina muelleri]
MDLSHDDFQKARRISRYIQEYLEMLNQDGLRSTDIYPYLAKKGIIEKDKHQGIHFRKFLHKLKKMELLNLIPQCSYRNTTTDFVEWYFYRVSDNNESAANEDNSSENKKLHIPILSELEIDTLIEKAKPHVEKLPKRDESEFSYTELETRKLYPRAYEKWTEKEIEIMTRAYNKFQKIDKVAQLLKRQPSVVTKKINESLT